MKSSRQWREQGDREGYEKSVAAGVNIIEVGQNQQMAEQFRTLTVGMDQAWYNSVAKRTDDAEGALAELREIARGYTQ